jgi:hypothetical protein
MDIFQKISPIPSFPKRGIIPPFGKGRLGGILQNNRNTIMRLLIIIIKKKPLYLRGALAELSDH